MELSARIEFSRDLERQLNTLRYPASSIKRILKRAGREVVNNAKREQMGGQGQLKRRSGKLKRSIKRVDDQIADFVVGVEAQEEYASVHEFGRVIRARGGGLLRWKTPGKRGVWRSARRVRIPARPFMEPSLRAFASVAGDFFDREIQRELARGLRL